MAISDPPQASPPSSPSASDGPSKHLQRLLRDDERVLWSTKPHKKAFYVATIVATLFLLGFLGLFTIPFFGPLFLALVTVGADLIGGTSAVALLLGGLVVGILALLSPLPIAYLVARYRYKHAEYALTDDRVIATSGLVGRDSSTVSLKDIRDVNTNVGILDKIFDTGNIQVQVAGGMGSGLSFNYLEDPYDVMETVEDARKKAEVAAQEG